MSYWVGVVPFGKMTIAAPGTTTKLSVNCGPLAGQVGGTPSAPPVPGQALRQITVEADAANADNVYILPNGKTLSANPGSVIYKLVPGASITIPSGVFLGTGLLPENICLDCDGGTNQIAYGFGIVGG